MRIEGKKLNGKPTSATVKKTNHKNEQALGKRAIEKIKSHGSKTALKKNFHHRIGGNKGKLEREDLYLQTHLDIDEQLGEVEEEFQKFNAKNDKTFRSDKMSKEEKDTLKMVKKILYK